MCRRQAKAKSSVVLVGLLLLIGACRKDAPPAKRVSARPAAPRRAAPVDALTAQCQTMAVPARGKQKSVVDPSAVAMPPRLGEGGTAAERRLMALRAIDSFSELLKRSPRNAEVHYRLGMVHLHSMENATAAIGHLCRAHLLDRAERRYRLRVLSAWMRPGNESRLELALPPAHRTLRWRTALSEVREASGTTELERATAFEDAIIAAALVRRSRGLQRGGTETPIPDLTERLLAWASEGPSERLRVVISFPERLRGRVRALRAREDLSERDSAVWSAPGPGPRWLLHGTTTSSLAPTLDYAAARLRGKRVGITLAQGKRQLYLIGRLKAARVGGTDGAVSSRSAPARSVPRMDVHAYGSRPPIADLRAALGLAEPGTQ